jgi:hypothetical protein
MAVVDRKGAAGLANLPVDEGRDRATEARALVFSPIRNLAGRRPLLTLALRGRDEEGGAEAYGAVMARASERRGLDVRRGRTAGESGLKVLEEDSRKVTISPHFLGGVKSERGIVRS